MSTRSSSERERRAGVRRDARGRRGDHGIRRAPGRARGDAPAGAPDGRGGDRGCPPRRRARGHRRPHECRGDLPQLRRARSGRRAGESALRRSPVPAQRAGEHGDGLPGSVDATAASGARPAASCTSGASISRRSPSPTALSRSTTSPPAAPERVALLFGAEGDGLSRRALEAADSVVTIPMAGGVDSLNVAAASAVAVWELRVR